MSTRELVPLNLLKEKKLTNLCPFYSKGYVFTLTSTSIMGVKDLWKHGVPGVKKKPPVNFETAKGSKIGIDISTMLCPLCKEPRSALLMTCLLPHPPTDVVDTLAQYHNLMIENEITPCYVLEGCKHPMKLHTHQERMKIKTKAIDKLNAFYELGKDPNKELTDEDHCESMKNVKIIASPNNEMLSLVIEWMMLNNVWFFGSPLEGE